MTCLDLAASPIHEDFISGMIMSDYHRLRPSTNSKLRMLEIGLQGKSRSAAKLIQAFRSIQFKSKGVQDVFEIW